MADILYLLAAMGGLLFTLSIGGGIAGIICRFPTIKRMFNRWYKTLPMGREEVRRLSRKRHSCKD